MCHPPQTPRHSHETRLLLRTRINDGGLAGPARSTARKRADSATRNAFGQAIGGTTYVWNDAAIMARTHAKVAAFMEAEAAGVEG